MARKTNSEITLVSTRTLGRLLGALRRAEGLLRAVRGDREYAAQAREIDELLSVLAIDLQNQEGELAFLVEPYLEEIERMHHRCADLSDRLDAIRSIVDVDAVP